MRSSVLVPALAAWITLVPAAPSVARLTSCDQGVADAAVLDDGAPDDDALAEDPGNIPAGAASTTTTLFAASPCGDANEDEEITAVDALIALRAASRARWSGAITAATAT